MASSEMTILIIDTTGLGFSCGIYSKDSSFFVNARKGLTHTEHAMGYIDLCFKEINKKPSDISLAAAVTGPGSFIGVRIGLSIFKGLFFNTNTLALGIPAHYCYAIPFFDFLDGSNSIMPLIFGKKNRFYGYSFTQKKFPPDANAFFDLEVNNITSLIANSSIITNHLIFESMDYKNNFFPESKLGEISEKINIHIIEPDLRLMCMDIFYNTLFYAKSFTDISKLEAFYARKPDAKV